MEFSENLKQLLNDRNMKQADLCRLTKIRSSLMSNYATGKKSPTIFNAVLIADAFDISLDALVGRRERVRCPGTFDSRYSGQPDGYAALPAGHAALPDGYAALPGGYAALPDGYTALPDGYTALPDGYAALPDGYTALPDGYAALPGGYPSHLNECMGGLTENESTFVMDMIQVMKKNFRVKEKQ